MKVMLTSFGIDQGKSSSDNDGYLFYQMPPVSFQYVKETFLPDYELLLLCDSIVLDENSFERLIDDRTGIYTDIADTFKALKSEGRIELVNFSSILDRNESLLNQMLDHDMKFIDQWVEPLRESLDIWNNFMATSIPLIYEKRKQSFREGDKKDLKEILRLQKDSSTLTHVMQRVMHSAMNTSGYIHFLAQEALESLQKRRQKEYRGPLREVIQSYLTYINANLVISNEMQVPFHDWQDFVPFYSVKFMSVGKSKDEVQERKRQVQKLFGVSFPDLAPYDTSDLLKILNDKRIEDLRALVNDAVEGNVEFDDTFAKAVLSEVFRSERKANRFRNILGYATLPIGFIPVIGTPAQKVVEEAIAIPVEKEIRKEHKWFYMLSEISEMKSKHNRKTFPRLF